MSESLEHDLSHVGTSAGSSSESSLDLQPPDNIQAEDMQSLMDSENGSLTSLRRGQTVRGIVASVAEDAVLVDVGTKSEGIVPREELVEYGEEMPELAYGQEILVKVLEPESRQGPILSLRQARREQAWLDMAGYVLEGTNVFGTVVDHNRGGAVVDVRGLRGFVPLSQLESPQSGVGPSTESHPDRLAQLHGQELALKVLEANPAQNRLILSQRAAEQERRAQRRADLLAELQAGQIRRGEVRNVTPYGAFVDLGGVDGLVHISEMSYDRVQNPRNLLHAGQEIDVYVLDVNPDEQRVALSLKKAIPDPWETLPDRYQPGEVVQVNITRLAKFGAFAQLEPGVEGLIHLTELRDEVPRDPGQVVREGQSVQAKVIHMDALARRLGLSLRQVHPAERQMTVDEWHQEQDTALEREPSPFEALSAIAKQLDTADGTALDRGGSTQDVPPAVEETEGAARVDGRADEGPSPSSETEQVAEMAPEEPPIPEHRNDDTADSSQAEEPEDGESEVAVGLSVAEAIEPSGEEDSLQPPVDDGSNQERDVEAAPSDV